MALSHCSRLVPLRDLPCPGRGEKQHTAVTWRLLGSAMARRAQGTACGRAGKLPRPVRGAWTAAWALGYGSAGPCWRPALDPGMH